MGSFKGGRVSISLGGSILGEANSVEIVNKYEVCIECKLEKPVYKLDLCEDCYRELFKEEKK